MTAEGDSWLSGVGWAGMEAGGVHKVKLLTGTGLLCLFEDEDLL